MSVSRSENHLLCCFVKGTVEIKLLNSVFWTWKACCLHEFMVAVDDWTRSTWDQASQYSILDGSGNDKTVPSCERLKENGTQSKWHY